MASDNPTFTNNDLMPLSLYGTSMNGPAATRPGARNVGVVSSNVRAQFLGIGLGSLPLNSRDPLVEPCILSAPVAHHPEDAEAARRNTDVAEGSHAQQARRVLRCPHRD